MSLPRSLFDGLRLGFLGGSFNPAHAGHREISLAALYRLKLDRVVWLVTPGNPQKPADSYAPLDTRMAQARAVAAHPGITVSDFEAGHGLKYTADTVRRLKIHLPGARMVWIMGGDALSGFHTWRDWKTIADTLPMAVFSRPGDRLAPIQAPAARIMADHRWPAENAPGIVTAAPPAWIWFPEANNRASSTALRA